jgi:hypothetical protein
MDRSAARIFAVVLVGSEARFQFTLHRADRHDDQVVSASPTLGGKTFRLSTLELDEDTVWNAGCARVAGFGLANERFTRAGEPQIAMQPELVHAPLEIQLGHPLPFAGRPRSYKPNPGHALTFT